MYFELTRKLRMLCNPTEAAYRLRARIDRAGLLTSYRDMAAASGFQKLYFVLSFDCDIEDDAKVAWDIHARLHQMGVTPVFAVPGELLNRGERIYRSIKESGGEFINHGYREHTYFDTTRKEHASCFFYDEESFETVRQDILDGDRNLRQTLGMTPTGFRAPHFGTFQRESQLRFMHGVLQELGYSFSSSTVPLFAYRYGPAFRQFGTLEIPVTGMSSSPLRILDSWTCFKAPTRRYNADDYLREGKLIADRFKSLGIGLLNFYADPSHIYDRPEFFEAVSIWASVAKPVTYNQLLTELS